MLPAIRRGCVIYGAVFGGMIAAMVGFTAYVYPFIALKLFMDIGVALEEVSLRLRNEAPPAAGVIEVEIKRRP